MYTVEELRASLDQYGTKASDNLVQDIVQRLNENPPPAMRWPSEPLTTESIRTDHRDTAWLEKRIADLERRIAELEADIPPTHLISWWTKW